jgi:hypothetical protein
LLSPVSSWPVSSEKKSRDDGGAVCSENVWKKEKEKRKNRKEKR